MIDSIKIREISKLSGLRPWQQEKHYLQSLILTIVSDTPIIFKGGTYLWFFHGLGRFSEDLDFTANGPIKSDLPDYISRSLDIYGFENQLKLIKNDRLGLSARFMINGPLHTSDKDRCVIYLEISKREEIVLPKLKLTIDLPQYDIPIKRILGMDLEEVAAEKVRAILTRKKGRDIYDLYYLIQGKKVRFDEELTNKKLSYYDMVFDATEFLEKLNSRKLLYKKELISIILGELPDFEKVKVTMAKWLDTG